MIDLSFAGLIGPFIGTAIAALAYAPLLAWAERFVGAGPGAGDGSGVSKPAIPPEEISLLRRAVLAVDIVAFAGFGYWLAASLAS
jgi:hypothetical protein